MGGGSLIAGKVGYAVSCAVAAVVLVVSGYAYKVVSLADGIGGGIGISNGASVGAMNILLMGLESRTDFYGQTLDGRLLAAMHAGSVYGVNNLGVGGQDTNTLILCNPYNPLGRAFSIEELRALSLVVTKNDARVISDEIHGPITYGQAHIPYASVADEAAALPTPLVVGS